MRLVTMHRFRHSPRPLPRSGDLALYNECLAIVKDQIRLMHDSAAALEWLNEVQRHLNRARQQAQESVYNIGIQDHYDAADS